MQQTSEITHQQITGQTTRKASIGLTITILLVSLSLLLIIGGGGLAGYLSIAHTSTLHVQATKVVQSLQTAQVQATVTQSPQYIYTQKTHENPSLSDPLEAQHYNWSTDNNDGTNCTFAGNAYHVQVAPGKIAIPCIDASRTYRDFIVQVQMRVIEGNEGGIIFRSLHLENSYFFILYDSGLYSLLVCNAYPYQCTPLAFGHVSIGKSKTNILAIMAHGSKIAMFVNKQYIGNAEDITFSAGAFGFIGATNTIGNTDVAFTNLQVWNL